MAVAGIKVVHPQAVWNTGGARHRPREPCMGIHRNARRDAAESPRLAMNGLPGKDG
jgi:hypothetical protein